MGDSASESDSSSLDGGAMLPPSTVSRDQLQKRIESLQQQNRYILFKEYFMRKKKIFRTHVLKVLLEFKLNFRHVFDIYKTPKTFF